MDGQTQALEERLEKSLRELVELAVALDRAKGIIQGVPHYSAIEQRGRELGRELSRRVQERHMGEILVHQAERVACPECGRRCKVEVSKRGVLSVDGLVGLQELEGYCPGCRRSFFPAAGAVGI